MSRSVVRCAAALALASLLGAPAAHADDLPPDDDPACNVVRKCSSNGLACDARDAACQRTATERSLEILCESRSPRGTTFVYCPPETARDSKVVWILLAVAALVATVGGVLVRQAVQRTGGTGR